MAEKETYAKCWITLNPCFMFLVFFLFFFMFVFYFLFVCSLEFCFKLLALQTSVSKLGVTKEKFSQPSQACSWILECQELFALSSLKLGRELWKVKSKTLSMLQTLALKFGVLTKKFLSAFHSSVGSSRRWKEKVSRHSKLWCWSLERWEIFFLDSP